MKKYIIILIVLLLLAAGAFYFIKIRNRVTIMSIDGDKKIVGIESGKGDRITIKNDGMMAEIGKRTYQITDKYTKGELRLVAQENGVTYISIPFSQLKPGPLR